MSQISYREWLLSATALVLTFVAARITRSILRRIGARSGRLRPLIDLAPALASLIYIVGLSVAIDLAPLDPKPEGWLKSALYILGVIILVRLARRAALVSIEWSRFRSSPSLTIQQGFIPILRNVLTLFIFTTGAIMILKHFGYDVMSLVAALGLGSLAVGLSAKDTVSNMISGFILIIDRNIAPGDAVNLGGTSGFSGEVEEIGLRSTRIRTGDGNTLIVPNSDLVNSKLLNLSSPTKFVTCTTRIRVPFQVPFERVKSCCVETLKRIPRAKLERGSWVNLVSLSEGHQLIEAGFWVATPDDQGAALSEFHELLLKRLHEESIALVDDAVLRRSTS